MTTLEPFLGTHLPPPEEHRILVVDDQPAAARQVAETIASLGYQVRTACRWTEALEIFTRETIDLVVMDAVMPRVDGFKLTALLRARARSYTPVLFLTSRTDAAARQLGLAAGADDFLGKPVDPFELKVRIAAMLRIRALTRALEARNQRLAKMAHVDGLTGLGNRRAFDIEVPGEVARARRFDLPLSVCLLDIDHFKRVNDDFGHARGDRVLAVMGRTLLRTSRASDRCYRLGGEEFAVIATETDAPQATVLADRIRETFRRACESVVPERPCTVSVGVAALRHATRVVDLLAAADQALYEAKNGGRDRTVVHVDAPAANEPPVTDASPASRSG